MSWYDDKLEWVADELIEMGYIRDEHDWQDFSEFMSESAQIFFMTQREDVPDMAEILQFPSLDLT